MHPSLHSYWQIRRRLLKNGFTCEFHNVDIDTPFFREKMRKFFGPCGVLLARLLRPGRWPVFMRTTLYIEAHRAGDDGTQ